MLFGNILALLNHVYAMDIVWKCNLEGIPHGMQTRNPNDTDSFKTLRRKQREVNLWYEEYTSKISAAEMSKSISFTFIGGGDGEMKIGEILHHVVNHATYHRGHIEGVMYQMLIEPPTTDIPVFLQTGTARKEPELLTC